MIIIITINKELKTLSRNLFTFSFIFFKSASYDIIKTEMLIEIITEEVPFLEHKKQSEAMLKFFAGRPELKGDLQVFSSPKILVIFLSGFQKEIIIPASKLKAPSAPQAMEGFLKKHNVGLKDLVKEGEALFLEIKEAKKPLKEMLEGGLLKELFEAICVNFSKTMVWNSTKKSWIRPIIAIKTNFNGELLKFEYAGVAASKSMGFEELTKNLKAEKIILQASERLHKIKTEITSFAIANGLKCVAGEKLFEENAYITSYPAVQFGEFEGKYLSLPEKVLILTLEKNQKYFLFKEEKTGKLKNVFAVCINGDFSEKTASEILNGNKKVLVARLEDAMYYMKLDLQENLLKHALKLEKVSFHKNAGSVFERVGRMQALAADLAKNNTGLSSILRDLQTAISLCKADLQTEMTQSFPELQGYIGGFYALREGYSKEISDAITSQYRLGLEETPVQSPKLSLYLALIEKMEKITTLLKAGEMPTSSRDPFGIRRDALAIIKIIIEGELDLNLNLPSDLKEVLLERFKFYCKGFQFLSILEGIKDDMQVNFLQVFNKIKFLEEFKSELGQYERVQNILNSKPAMDFIEKNKIELSVEQVNDKILTEKEAKILEEFKAVYKLEDFLSKANLIEGFFKDFMIIDEKNKEVTRNRLMILNTIDVKMRTFLASMYQAKV